MWRISATTNSRTIHHWSRSVRLKASEYGSSGLSVTSASMKNANSTASSKRNLIRSQNARGFRVLRSLSRRRLTYFGFGDSRSCVTTPVMSVRPYCPGVDRLVDLLAVVLEAIGATGDRKQVQLRVGLVDDRDLTERDLSPTLVDDDAREQSHATEPAIEGHGLVREELG